ncbi:MAG: chromate efflux transporter [Cypionkella sp.]|nr:chromate efflux transporter [Cypionkella sp.]
MIGRLAMALSDLTRAFARIGVLSFGGPAAQIGLMSREFVQKRGWLTEAEYLSALSFCMLLPGPEAMQLATYIGWKRAGVLGGLIAGGLFVLPGAALILALAMVYAAFGSVPLIAALFVGVQAAVLAIVIEALLRLSKRALTARGHLIIAAAAFAALFVFALPFPVVILGAAAAGAILLRQNTAQTGAPIGPAPWRASAAAALIGGAAWLLPLAGTVAFAPQILGDIALFFSKLALLTFGGAYAVMAWMVDEVVQTNGWLTPAQMLDALALAETTPGPLILVTEFVAYIAAHAQGGVWMGVAGAAVALWMTFVPCFLWIFAGAPWMSRLQSAPRLSAALAGIMAAVVGVIAHLSLWFALHVLFGRLATVSIGPAQVLLPDLSTLRALPFALALLSGWLLLRRHWPLPAVLLVCAALSGVAALINAAN